MSAIDYACSYQDANGWTCGAQAGELCQGLLQSGRRVPLKFMHAERIEAAAAMESASSETPTQEDFDKAVEGITNEYI